MTRFDPVKLPLRLQLKSDSGASSNMKTNTENCQHIHENFISERDQREGRERYKTETIKDLRHNVIQINGKRMKRIGCVYVEQT